MRSMSARLAVLVLLPAVALNAQQQQGSAKRAFALSDWYKLTTVSTPALSPDGSRVAFTVTTVREGENKRHSEVWVAPTNGGEPMRYTSPGTESSNPRFSGDGKYLFFTSNRPGGRGATWALRMDVPGGEAFQPVGYPDGSLTNDTKLVAWAESADSVAGRGARGGRGGRGGGSGADSAAPNDPYGRMPAMSRPPYGAITKPADPARFDGRHVTEMVYKSNNNGFLPGPREARTWHPAQIFVAAPGDSASKRRVTNTRYSHRDPQISPDGKWIAFLADAELRPDSLVQAERDSIARLPYDAKRDEKERNDVDIFVVPVAGGEPRRVATYMGTEGNVSWSPDGSQLAFIGRPARVKSARVYTVPFAGGTPTNLLGNWQYEPNDITWLADGQILLTVAIGGRGAAFRLDPSTKKLTEILGGRRQISGVATNASGKTLAFVATDLTHPTEIFTANADGSGERKLTSFNDKLNAEVAWSDADRFTYKSVGNLEIEGWLMKPYGYEPGKKYPLVLYIHGGPHSAYGEGWFDEFQNLAAEGMWVLFTNPRGSSGYGADFTYSTRGRWGAEDYQDLMKAVDIVSKRPDVDSTRMGVTGGSYGGFMTAWVETKTNRFKAAETDRMISDWTYWYGASDAQGLTEFEFYGKPWDNFAMYDTLSPIRHVTKVKTPTLMVQSEDDFRTPMGNAELWYMALKKQGVPVELVRYPRSTHELSRSGEPWLLVDRLGRLRQWFSYWLKEKPATAAN